jgi:2'-5' RNA ligase
VADTKRTFIAIELSPPVRARFDELQRLLKPAGADVRWVRPDRAHLTLKFLGDATDEQIEAMEAALDEIAPATAPFEVAFGGVGVFPNERRPRVLWIGITDGVEELRSLASAVDARAEAAGFERERRAFSAHVTLGRFRSPAGWERLHELVESNAAFDAGRLEAREVALIHSILSPQGPTYVPLHAARFAPAG